MIPKILPCCCGALRKCADRVNFLAGGRIENCFCELLPAGNIPARSDSRLLFLGETTSHSTRLQTTAAKSLVIPLAGESWIGGFDENYFDRITGNVRRE